MSAHEDSLKSLLEALQFSPENVPLLKHVASILMELKRYEEAEKHYQTALSKAPADAKVKFGLANSFFQQDKHSASFIIIEELIENNEASPEAYILHARLSIEAEDYETANDSYRLAVQLDPGLEEVEIEDVIKSKLGQKALGAGGEGELVPVEIPEDNFFTEVERPTIKFEDVGGMDSVKEEIGMKIIHPLAHPELYKAYGKAIGGGVMLYGPPGCGKTYLARATAGEVNASFIAVGINDVLDMWMGNSEKNLHRIFQLARSKAPCVLFFDEVDALGASRSDMKQSGGRHLINQFLSELDGVQHSNDGVLILAATNTPWNMDPAFRRPGRFDRILFVPPPDEVARARILEILLREKPIGNINFARLAKKAKGNSGADLKAVIDVAIEKILRESMKKGQALPIEEKDLKEAIAKVKPSTKDWFATARNYALYSNESGLYDDILAYLNIKR